MKYALLIYDDETNWSDETGDMTPWMEYTKSAIEAGVFRSGSGLMKTAMATSVRVRNRKTTSTDGPFAETKEQLGGFYILELNDLDEAIAWASRIPSVGTGTVEIRPVLADGE